MSGVTLVPESVVPYLVLVFNSVLFKGVRILHRRWPTPNAEPFLGEFIGTLEVCASSRELSVIFLSQGLVFWAVSLTLLFFWWCASLENSIVCNTSLVEDIVVEGKFDKREFLQRHFGMILGALTTRWYNGFIWSFHMTEEHTALHMATECIAGLQVSALGGALIECLLSFLRRLVALETTDWRSFNKAVAANCFASIALVVAGLRYTGGFFNPILALAFNFGCQGNTYLEHVVVYWVGALAGGILARVFHNSIILTFKGGMKRGHTRAD